MSNQSEEKPSWSDFTTRRGIFLAALLFFIFGIFGYDIILSWVGILTFFVGLILFLTDSWVIYLLIYFLWLLGGISGFSNAHNILGTFFSVLVVLYGGVAALFIIVNKTKNVKGKVDL